MTNNNQNTQNSININSNQDLPKLQVIPKKQKAGNPHPVGNHLKTKHKAHAQWGKTLKNKENLRSIFKDRINPLLGLTKVETISIYYGLPLKKVEKYETYEINEMWIEINSMKKQLREADIMAIVPLSLPIGTILNDTALPQTLGIRELDRRTEVYHRCTDINIAKAHKKRLVKCGEGFMEAGEQIEDITSKIINQMRVYNTLKV